LCCVFVFFISVLCALTFQFLWIVHLGFPFRYYLPLGAFMYCMFRPQLSKIFTNENQLSLCRCIPKIRCNKLSLVSVQKVDYPFGIIYHLSHDLCLGHCGWLLLNLWISWLSNNLTVSVPGEVYSTHALCAFHMLSTFLLTVVYDERFIVNMVIICLYSKLLQHFKWEFLKLYMLGYYNTYNDTRHRCEDYIGLWGQIYF
jgi:hypothetical protein